MIEVGIVDLSAEGRRRLAGLVERWSWVNPESKNLTLPRLSLHLLSPEEVRFHGGLDVCLVGPELVSCDVAHLGVLRRQLPGKILMCVLDSRSYSFGMIEQLGRLEIDDVLMDSASSDEFFRRLILLKRRVSGRRTGRTIVIDSARGGVGATFITAGLSEAYVNSRRKVCLVDCDAVSSDLTRFLQCRPFVNEPLKVLLDQQRVVTAETVKECVFPVWADEPDFVCVPPPAASDETVFAPPQACRTLLSVLEVLQTSYDVVLLDASPMTLGVKQTLYQVADEVVFVLNRDAAGAYANRHAVSLISGHMRREARFTAIINDVASGGASISALKQSVLTPGDRQLSVLALPHSPKAGRWACSGHTPERYLRKVFTCMVTESQLAADEHENANGWLTEIFAKGIGALANRARAAMGRERRLKRKEPDTRGEELRPTLVPELPLLTGDAPDEDLVSKPVVAG